MIALTGASGRLGRLVARMLIERIDAGRVVALEPHAAGARRDTGGHA